MTTTQNQQIRQEVRAWLAEHWNPDQPLLAWRKTLVDSGWGVPDWPSNWYGKDFSAEQARLVEEEFAQAGAVTVAKTGIRLLAAATLLAHGNDYHKQTFLRPLLTGEDTWCQLFSEPGSGSDLAGATTRADAQANDWVINGQKVWTTSAHHAQWGLLLARTDWQVPKHQGLTFFVIDMTQPGVDVQPLKQMNGHASFNQVFFTDALVPDKLRISEPGAGWQTAMTTLAHERRSADGSRGINRAKDLDGQVYAEEREEIERVMEPYKWYPQRAGRVDLILTHAQHTGRIEDPLVRQEIARLLSLSNASQWTARRARAAQAQGKPQGPEGSLGKLAASHVARKARDVHALIHGADALLAGADGPAHGLIAEVLLSVPATSIAGGTDEIQRNIIAERVLGLPKEPRMDGGPFKDVPKNS